MRNKKGEQVYERQYINHCTLHPHKLSITVHPLEKTPRSYSQRNTEQYLTDTEHEGRLSDKARKRLEIALQWLLYVSKPKRVRAADTGKQFSFKINFITLTLSAKQQHTDEEIKQTVLKNFIARLSKSHNLTNYIWRAEAQANGNIHFHLTTDVYVHYNEVRRIWNESQELLGYVSEYEKKWHNRNPNSTDIHSVKHVKQLAQYLSKYMAKNRAFPCIGELRQIKGEVVEVLYGTDMYRQEEANQKKGKVIGHIIGSKIRSITGRLWYCSRSLSRLKGIKVNEEVFDFCEVQKLVQSRELREVRCDHAVMYFGDVVGASQVYSREIYRMFKAQQ
jgi:hypothetical protein